MKAFILVLALSISVSIYASPSTSSPVAVTAQQLAQYNTAMHKALADLKVTMREVSLRDSLLQVSYEDRNEQASHAFILRAVLTLVAPLANGCEEIRVSNYEAGRKLSEMAIAPEDIRSFCAAELNDREEERLQELAASVLTTAGLSAVPTISMAPVVNTRPAAPVAKESTEPKSPAPAALSKRDEQQLAEKLLAALATAKLENITVAREGQQAWIISFENRTYRSDIDALATALRLIAKTLPPVPLGLEIKKDEVPVCHMRLQLDDYAAEQGHLLTPEELVRRWRVEPNALEKPQSVETLVAGNSSRGKVDIALRPVIHYEIGNEAKPFMSDEFIVARADTTLARGWHANLQSSTRLTSGTSSVLDHALLTKTGWIGRNFLATGSVGQFENYLYGWYGEIQWDRRQHRLGLIASSIGDNLSLGSDTSSQAIGYYEYEWGATGLTARLGYGRFVNNASNAGLLSLRRRFGESLVTAEAIRAQGGDEAVNFRISVPLGPKVAQAPSSLRLRSDTAFKEDYMSNLLLKGAYLQNGQDLASFRGELTAPYVEQHFYRVLNERQPQACSQWPASPSLEGNSGLIRIPTADVIADGTLLAGISYMDRDHSRVVAAETDAMPLFVAVSIMPNLEMVGKLTVMHDIKAFDWGYNTDRSFNLHYRLIPQKRYLPALAVGAQDVTFGTTSDYLGKAQYVVGTWAADRYRLHLGVGRDRLQGLFGGADYDLAGNHRLQLMMDYDTKSLNAGVRGLVSKWLTMNIDFLGMSRLGGAVVFQTELQ